MLAIALSLLVLAVVAVLLKRRGRVVASDDPDDEAVMRAALELHAISRRLDVAWTRHELQNEANRLRRELSEELQRVETLEARERGE